ncbi:MAG: pyridoxamine 5'-phosphate oxidase family protein [Pseudomonadota bacterium]
MGKTYAEIDDRLGGWLSRQHVFFVATAPSGGDGHVNCSPKGLDSFRVLGPLEVAYLDLTGSGAETIAHLRDNGRIVLLFAAFEGRPKIVRLYGSGEAVLPGDDRFAALAAEFDEHPGTRSVIRVDVTRIADSCGYGVPLYGYRGERDGLDNFARHRGAAGLAEYRAERNRLSIDGLPALDE